MRFLADMGISPRTVDWLRERGHDAVHVLDERAGTTADTEIFAWAIEKRRILLTHDLDFSDLIAASQGELPTVILFRLRDMRPSSVNRVLELLLDSYADELTACAIFTLREGHVRWRPLPL